MERILSPEERIRRAEEIYNRRKSQSGVRVSTNTVNAGNQTTAGPQVVLLKKMVIQIMICLVIYFAFYMVRSANHIFSDDVISKTKELLSYDINFSSIYSQASGFVLNFLSEQNENKENEEQINDIENQDTQGIEEIQSDDTQAQNTGGVDVALEELTLGVTDEQSQNVQLTQMEMDANDIKSNFTFIKPLQGTITSRFGNRNPTTATVPKYHTGIDIAVNTGTVFIAAISGIVELVSSQGDYGNHIKIVNGDVTTLYAHCNKIYVNQGDSVSQGDKIGEVGSTGNTTGPHLHFEIRKQDRYVDPDLVLEI